MSNKYVRIANSGENIKKMLDKGGIVDRLAKGGGGGGGGSTTLINPDLSQNDETAIDYIKNRTHYVEETISIVDSIELTKDGFLIIRLNDNFSLNEKYYINIDNKISNLTITKDEYGSSHITGYPDWRFVDGHILTSLANIPEVIDIYKEKVVTLDEKYIPDSVVRNFGKNNKAISENDTIFGTSNTAGTKAFYISSIDMENKQIYLSTTKTEGLPSLTDHQIDGNMLDSNLTNVVVGDVFSIINNVHYPLCGAVLDIDYDNGIITYGETTIELGNQYRKVKFPADLPFTEFLADTNIDGHTIYFHNKPEVGSVVLKGYSFSVGQYNIGAGKWSFNQGWNNIINGDLGVAFGDRNIVGYNATAFGALNIANGERSFAEGQRTQAWGVNSHAAGQYTIAKGKNQFVIGQFNIPDESSLFIIGNGTNENSNISNAMTVDRQGNAWFAGDISLGLNNTKLLKSSDLYGINKNIKLGEKNTLPTVENDTTKEANIAIGGSNKINTKWATTIGRDNTTSSEVSVLIGYQNKANVTAGYNILVGTRNEATQGSTFAFGKDLITNRYEQTVLGRRNATDDQAIFIIGNGLNTNSRVNAFVIKHNNEIYAAGNIYSDNKKLATEDFVSERLDTILGTGAPETLDTIAELAVALGNDPNFREVLATKDYVDEQIKPTATIIDGVLVVK